jgi:hypothetical protein
MTCMERHFNGCQVLCRGTCPRLLEDDGGDTPAELDAIVDVPSDINQLMSEKQAD